jgi:hypothetical protein
VSEWTVTMPDTHSGASTADEAAGRGAYEAYLRVAWPVERRREEPALILPWSDLPVEEKRGWIAAAKASRGS